MNLWCRTLKGALPAAAALVLLFPWPGSAQEETASAIRRYKEREASTGYYEEYEAKPRRQQPLIRLPEVGPRAFRYSPKAAEIRIRSHLADSHRALKFYDQRRCEECHVEQAKNTHSERGNLTCRQCHGGEPIASIQHYFSPLNPIRAHSYVCAKCHEGANPSFATYLVHEPPAGSPQARKTFPLLYYANWFMLLLLAGVFAFFIPHSVAWLIREFFPKKEGKSKDDSPGEN